MKNIFYVLSLFSAVLLFSCSKESGQPVVADGSPVIKVQDGGYTGTKASEEDYTTVFTAGDRIGVFMLENGTISGEINNICFTAVESGEGLVWEADLELPSLSDMDGKVVYAYYPYTADLPAEVNLSASDDEGFFAAVADAWPVANDQSDYADYTASDFMTSAGMLDGRSLNFSMKHRMFLASIILPNRFYVFTNEDIDLPNYNILPSNLKFEGFAPCILSNGAFAYLINPAGEPVTFSGEYGQGQDVLAWTVEPEPVSGCCHRYVIDDAEAVEIRHELQVGDFFLADGSLLSKDADAATVGSSEVVGIVFQINPDRIGEGEKAALGNSVHGLVMATKTLGDYEPFQWFVDASGNCSRDETEIGIEDYVGSDSYNTFELVDDDIEGYETNRLIREKRAADFEAGYYPVFKAAYESSSATLMNHTTGWYLPSNGQWFDIIRNLGGVALEHDGFRSSGPTDFYWENLDSPLLGINAAMSKVAAENKNDFVNSGYYWTASTATSDMARYIGLRDVGSNVMCVATYRKDYLYGRCILAF